jgi:branched-chain amino acid transport system substrate-binding protein
MLKGHRWPKSKLFDYDASSMRPGQQMKKMILEDKVDFIMGSIHSGVQKACFPLAEQYKIPFFGGGAMTAEFTGEGACPYYIRVHTHAKMQAIAGWKWGFDNMGKKWTFLVADYAWGHSMAKEFGSRVMCGGKTQDPSSSGRKGFCSLSAKGKS